MGSCAPGVHAPPGIARVARERGPGSGRPDPRVLDNPPGGVMNTRTIAIAALVIAVILLLIVLL